MVVRAVLAIVQQDRHRSVRAACERLRHDAQCGRADPTITAKLCDARDRRGRSSADGMVSLVTLQRWVADFQADPCRLVPQPSSRPDLSFKPWMAAVVQLMATPTKRSLRSVHEEIASTWPTDAAARQALGGDPPTYSQVQRFWSAKYSSGDGLLGRHTGSALRAHKPYQPRSAAGLLPFQFVMGDGWTTHFSAPHPVTGLYVTYEVWHFHDAVTRYVTPPSVGRSESSRVILKAIENCIRVGGLVRELMTDHTGSVKNAKVEIDPLASVSARAGFTVKHPVTVGNSQANGVSESFNRYLDDQARELVTYQNPKAMDEGAFKRVRKITAKAVKLAAKGLAEQAKQLKKDARRAGGDGLLFESHDAAVAWLMEKVEAFNALPHRGLPRVRDAGGCLVHMSPLQVLQAYRDDGWEPLAVDESTLVDLFREHARKKVQRGMVNAYNGQLYKHEALWHHNGEEVLVAIDETDWRSVIVKTLDGALICEAPFVQATGYSTLTAQEAAQEKLDAARIKLRENQIDAIRSESPGLTVDSPALPAPALAVFELPAQPNRWREPELLSPPLPSTPRAPEPRPLTVMDTYEWIAREKELRAAREAAQAASAEPAAAATDQGVEGAAKADDGAPEKRGARS